jgi:hypothetical protein
MPNPETNQDTTDVFYLSDFSPVPGSYSRLLRTNNSLTVNVNTSDLPQGAYTLWWLIYNHPEECTVPFECLDPAHDEAIDSPVQFAAQNATGKIVGESGVGNFSASIKIGGPPSGEVLQGPGLLNPAGALVVMIVRYHGPALPGMIPLQISMFNGGCAINNCEDMQIAIHEP